MHHQNMVVYKTCEESSNEITARITNKCCEYYLNYCDLLNVDYFLIRASKHQSSLGQFIRFCRFDIFEHTSMYVQSHYDHYKF